MPGSAAARSRTWRKARESSTSEGLFPKLVDDSGGAPIFKDQPPSIVHWKDHPAGQIHPDIQQLFARYRESLSPDHRILLDRYALKDAAQKVVGVGSVGTACWMLLLMAGGGDPLILQFKEARASVLEAYAGASVYPNHGQRVVNGHRLMQPASDIFLGWTSGRLGRHFYVRQLRDIKIKLPVETFDMARMTIFAKSCGYSLALSHARSGDAAVISGYMGKGDTFDKAIARILDRVRRSERKGPRRAPRCDPGRKGQGGPRTAEVIPPSMRAMTAGERKGVLRMRRQFESFVSLAVLPVVSTPAPRPPKSPFRTPRRRLYAETNRRSCAEKRRMTEAREHVAPWKKWGPYLSERQWGTVREDYSQDGNAWDYFSHDQARSRAYHWGEDGLAGISDDHQVLCFALALWNGRDPILKERLFGLTNSEGNHGEDVKEYYFYLDSTPTHSYMKYLYKYPQAAYPYGDLIETNRRRGKQDLEYELLDTGVFDNDRYFDVFVEYAKDGPEDFLIKISAANRGPEAAPLHLLPTLWFRNTWSWMGGGSKPMLERVPHRCASVISAHHTDLLFQESLPDYNLFCEGVVPLLFTENETQQRAPLRRSQRVALRQGRHQQLRRERTRGYSQSGVQGDQGLRPLLPDGGPRAKPRPSVCD